MARINELYDIDRTLHSNGNRRYFTVWPTEKSQANIKAADFIGWCFEVGIIADYNDSNVFNLPPPPMRWCPERQETVEMRQRVSSQTWQEFILETSERDIIAYMQALPPGAAVGHVNDDEVDLHNFFMGLAPEKTI
jgi:hypothetical protein